MKKLLTNITGTRFGNHLYFYLFASKTQDIYIEYIEDMAYWNQFFPKLKLFWCAENVDKQKLENILPNESFYQAYNKDFSQEELNQFIEKYLIEDVAGLISKNPTPYDCVFNIRRGDFYNKEHKYLYGFDQLSYLQDVLLQMRLPSSANVAVISDDIVWCEQYLTILKSRFLNVHFLKTTPVEAFIECVKAKKLVITNSTFSYWAAYLNAYMMPENEIYAPDYNTVKMSGRQISALPTWIILPVKPYKSSLFACKQKVKKYIQKIKKILKGEH